MRLLVAMVLCCLISASTHAESQETLPPPELLLLQDEIVFWLSETFKLPNSESRPRIVLTPQPQIIALRFRGLIPNGVKVGPNNIVAVYDEHEKTIHLPEHWKGRTPADQSVLVHEIVHHLQSVAKATFECPQAREKLAYKAQEEWLRRSDLSLESEFGLDPFSLLIHTSCAV